MMQKPETIDEYISQFPEPTQDILRQIRDIIRSLAPEANEKISYGIPTYVLDGNRVHFGAYEHHVSLYPGSAGIETFKHELAGYHTSRGTIQFPLDKPIPFELIERIATHCLHPATQ